MSDAWLNQFETRLDAIEREAALDAALYSNIQQLANSASAHLAETSDLDVLLVRPESSERFSAEGLSFPIAAAEHQSLLAAIERGTQFNTEDSAGEAKAVVHRITVVHALAKNLTLVLVARCGRLIAPEQSVAEGLQAIATVIGSFVSRQLLSQYETRIDKSSSILSLVNTLHLCKSSSDAANVLAQDGAAVLGNVRLTVCQPANGRARVAAVTGVKQPNAQSASVQAAETLVNSSGGDSAFESWVNLGNISSDDVSGKSADVVAAAATLMQSGVTQCRIIPLHQHGNDTDIRADIAVPAELHQLMIETFNHEDPPDETLVQQIVAASAAVFAATCQREQSWLPGVSSGRLKMRVLIAAAIFAFLSFWPADFEVEVNGRIESSNQRKVFAAENGTVEDVLFVNEATVTRGQPLLTMSNPDMDLERQQVLGDIETTTARLASVRALRLTGGDAKSSGEEQLAMKQLENLQKQLQLIELQSAALQITAPFDGIVFLRNPQQELTGRPVQRGQLLFEVIPIDDTWRLDLKIPDHLVVYVNDAIDSGEEHPAIRYRIKAAPDQDWATNLTTVDNAVQLVDGQLVCHGTAELQSTTDQLLRPGTSVFARISCGRRSLCFVWFREVIEFWQQVRFAWL